MPALQSPLPFLSNLLKTGSCSIAKAESLAVRRPAVAAHPMAPRQGVADGVLASTNGRAGALERRNVVPIPGSHRRPAWGCRQARTAPTQHSSVAVSRARENLVIVVRIAGASFRGPVGS